jgi:hypothetical protein
LLSEPTSATPDPGQIVRVRQRPFVMQEVLGRLLQLNHDRYAEDVQQGLHEKGAAARRRGKQAGGRAGTFLPLLDEAVSQ